jgi:hypothetical protein
MKKYVFTESQIKKIVNHLIKEESEVEGCGRPGMPSQRALFKDSEISEYDNQKEFRSILTSPNCKFKVIRNDGGVKLNGKPAQEGMIIVPNTTVEMCNMSSYLMISGMGYPEAFMSWGDTKPMFGSQRP